MSWAELLNESEEAQLFILGGCVRSECVEHPVTKGHEFLRVMCGLSCPSRTDNGVDESVIRRQSVEVDAAFTSLQVCDGVREILEPYLHATVVRLPDRVGKRDRRRTAGNRDHAHATLDNLLN